VVNLFTAGPVDVAHGVLAEGTFTSTDIITRADSPSCPGGLQGATVFEDLVERLRNGTAYVNVHTRVTPSGAIRGQVH
jgi:hypothetical protein